MKRIATSRFFQFYRSRRTILFVGMTQGRLGHPTVLERLFLTANAAEPQAGSWGEAAAVATRKESAMSDPIEDAARLGADRPRQTLPASESVNYLRLYRAAISFFQAIADQETVKPVDTPQLMTAHDNLMKAIFKRDISYAQNLAALKASAKANEKVESALFQMADWTLEFFAQETHPRTTSIFCIGRALWQLWPALDVVEQKALADVSQQARTAWDQLLVVQQILESVVSYSGVGVRGKHATPQAKEDAKIAWLSRNQFSSWSRDAAFVKWAEGQPSDQQEAEGTKPLHHAVAKTVVKKEPHRLRQRKKPRKGKRNKGGRPRSDEVEEVQSYIYDRWIKGDKLAAIRAGAVAKYGADRAPKEDSHVTREAMRYAKKNGKRTNRKR
jgi:hypothetical protein